MCFRFKQMQNEDIAVFINEMFEILASNMNVIAPTGNSYDADFKIWSECVVPVWREGKRLVILIFCEDTLCGFFQYFVNYKTFRMDSELTIRTSAKGTGSVMDQLMEIKGQKSNYGNLSKKEKLDWWKNTNNYFHEFSKWFLNKNASTTDSEK